MVGYFLLGTLTVHWLFAGFRFLRLESLSWDILRCCCHCHKLGLVSGPWKFRFWSWTCASCSYSLDWNVESWIQSWQLWPTKKLWRS